DVGGTGNDVALPDVNLPPTLDPIPDPAPLPGNSGAHAINLTGISAGGAEVQTLTVTASSSNPVVIPNPTVTYSSPNGTGSLSYTPVTNQSGAAVITLTVTDDGGTANGGAGTAPRAFTAPGGNGGAARIGGPFAAGAGNPPVLDPTGTPMLPFIPVLGKVPATGGPISDLSENVTDADPGAPKGVAVTAVDNTHGTWQFNLQFDPTQPETGWAAIPAAVSPTNALLLADDGNTRVRFVPKPLFTGFASLTFRAWDQSKAGLVEGGFDDTTTGTDTCYSTASDRGWVAVGKTKPTVNPDGRTVLAPILPVIP